MEAEVSSQPRVNSARLGDFLGRTVRLVCKVERITDTSAIVRATDLGQVEVKTTMPMEDQISGKFVEIIGRVDDSNIVRMEACIPLGEDLDVNLVNECIEMMHDPRFQKIF